MLSLRRKAMVFCTMLVAAYVLVYGGTYMLEKIFHRPQPVVQREIVEVPVVRRRAPQRTQPSKIVRADPITGEEIVIWERH